MGHGRAGCGCLAGRSRSQKSPHWIRQRLCELKTNLSSSFDRRRPLWICMSTRRHSKQMARPNGRTITSRAGEGDRVHKRTLYLEEVKFRAVA